MGRSINMYKFKYDELIKGLMLKKEINDQELLERILLKCGEKIGNYYIILYNEYNEKYNPFQVLSFLIDRAFNIINDITDDVDDSFEILLNNSTDMISSVDEEEVAEELGILKYWRK